MLLTQLNKLFVYIPLGYGQDFINNCSLLDEYKQKIVFVADTKEIYTNGRAFGVSSVEFQSLINLVNANKAELDQKIEEISEQQTGDVSTLVDRLNVLEGDAETPGSVAYAIKQLQDLILGADTSELIQTLDTIKEIGEWIQETGIDTLPQMVEDISTNAQAIADETERATQAESDLEARVKAIEDIEIWMTYESDAVPETADTVYGTTANEIGGIADPETTDVVVSTQDALGFFTDPSNASTTFQNISI